MFNEIIDFVKSLYPNLEQVPLHAPVFLGNEKKYVNECIDSTFVSSVGQFVNRFEKMMCEFTGAKFAVATTSGTSALHVGLVLLGVNQESEVLTQALTFVATANAIKYTGAQPIFIDSSAENLGMCPLSLRDFLSSQTRQDDQNHCINKTTKKRIAACVPMHVFGSPVDIYEIVKICNQYNIPVLEDAAESLGSMVKNVHTGLIGDLGILSFNGNKIVTCGGGGMIITNNEKLAIRAKHMTTTSKIPHKWEFFHDEVGFNYRLPNLNAAMACAQMESLRMFLDDKRQTAQEYKNYFSKIGIRFIDEPLECRSNFWLNAIELNSLKERDLFLKETNDAGVMTRPIWKLMTDLPVYENCQKTNLEHAQKYVERVVNLPSSVRHR